MVQTGFSLEWLAPTLIGIGSLLTSGVAAFVSLRASNKADDAKTAIAKAEIDIVDTHKLVNSRMDEMLKLAKDEATATATAVAQEAERIRTAETQRVIDLARVAETAKAASVVEDTVIAEVARPRRRKSKGDVKR